MTCMTRALFLCLLMPIVAVAAPANQWLEQVPATLGDRHDWREIPRDTFFEVTPAALMSAESLLGKASWVMLDRRRIASFGESEIKCATESRPFLIRALTTNTGGTGAFSLYWAKSALVVSFFQLGSPGSPSRAALVACLPKVPGAVFASLGAAL